MKFTYRLTIFGLLFGLWPLTPACEPWWTQEQVEVSRTVHHGVMYERVYYHHLNNKPVRAHILSVTGVGKSYIFGVLGSFGTLFPPTEFAKQSGSIAIVNGGYFSKNPTRGQGLVMAHNRVLYPPNSNSTAKGTIGFSPTDVLFDWIGVDDIQGNRIHTNKPGWNECHAALGAGPLLVKEGKPLTNTELEGFNKALIAPRTAMGKRSDGLVWMIVVDGRQPTWSYEGVTLQELTEIFLSRKAEYAINLDGGGSSVMVVGTEIVNRPSDNAITKMIGTERPVANVIALFEK